MSPSPQAVARDEGHYAVCATRDAARRVGLVPAHGRARARHYAKCVVTAEDGGELVVAEAFDLIGAYVSRAAA